MYLTNLKTAFVMAVKETFDSAYPEPDFRNLFVSVEYPMEAHHYPGCWVDYEDTQPLQVVGINHVEYSTNAALEMRGHTRWKFAGMATFTVVALTSLERDRLYDEFVRVLAFGRQAPATARFRSYIQNNPFLAIQFDFDEIEVRGASVGGTPWGDETTMIYERTINMEVIGEFVSDGSTGLIVPLSEIRVVQTVEGEEEPSVEPPTTPTYDWH